MTQKDLIEDENVVNMLRMDNMLLSPTLPPIRQKNSASRETLLDGVKPSLAFLSDAHLRAGGTFASPPATGVGSSHKLPTLKLNSKFMLKSENDE